MTSVHSTAHGFDHRLPSFDEASQLGRLVLVQLGDLLELSDFQLHQWQVAKGPQPSSRHFDIAHQGLAAEDDALIGFFCGHSHISRQNPQLVNGGTNG